LATSGGKPPFLTCSISAYLFNISLLVQYQLTFL
jgi:hypothetical protein